MKLKQHILVLILLMNITAVAQQDAHYTQYQYNPFIINPAYSGTNEMVSGVLLHRSQWVGMEGAPMTQTFSIHSPSPNGKMGYGLQLIHDKIGLHNYMHFSLAYAYKLKIGTSGKLSMGIRGGIFRTGINQSKLDYEDPSDPESLAFTPSIISPDADFGIYYNSHKYFAGLVINHLISSGNNQLYNNKHFLLNAGYYVDINEDITVFPSALVKMVKSTPINFDINTSVIYKNKLAAGLSYRNSRELSILLKYQFNPSISAGYSFDADLNPIRTQARAGSHEIFLGWNLNVFQTKTLSPRFL